MNHAAREVLAKIQRISERARVLSYRWSNSPVEDEAWQREFQSYLDGADALLENAAVELGEAHLDAGLDPDGRRDTEPNLFAPEHFGE